MAKMLEALERARQERLRKMQGDAGGDDAPAAPSGLEGVVLPSPPACERPAVEPGNGPLFSQAMARTAEPASDLVVGVHEENSPVAEQVRHIRSNMESVLADYRTRVIAVTSPVSGDGKTLIAANLASVLADAPDQRVILIDADMRKPDQHNLLRVAPAPGLAEYLQGKIDLASVIQPTCLPNLQMISAGRTPRKPTVLLGSDRMHQLTAALQRDYQWILFDTPPLLPVTDATVLGRECVGMILVLRMGQTPRSVIERAQNLLAEMRLPVLGCILNDFTHKSRDNQYYYKYYHKTHPEPDAGFKK